MKTVPCPVCFGGKIPVDFDFYPYHDELDCPYCNGNSYLNPEDPLDASTIEFLNTVDVNDPDFQEETTKKTIEKASRIFHQPLC